MDKILYKSNTSNGDYNFVMAYPAKEEFALSSLGYMWLYKIADSMDGVNASRVSDDIPIFPFKRTDAAAFSLSFDFDFMGVLNILEQNKIPFYSAERTHKTPLIFAGGPVITTNPQPYDDIFDFMIIGDGEDTFTEVLEVLKLNKDKAECLELLSKIEGVYVPGINKIVKKRTTALNDVIYTPIISDKSYFKDTFIVELQRGCMNRCAFCTASYLNLPFRHYPYEKIVETIDLGLKYTNKIALLGAQISAHPDFNQIICYLRDKIESGIDIELGISSLRTDSITPELVQLLVMGGQKTSTIAIEAASERLRKFINKNLSNEQIFKAVKICRENGLRGLKVYSMIGIPSETEEDINAFITLAKELKSQNKGFDITFSFSSFVPKPQTPFEREKREDTKSLEKKQKFLEKELSKIGISSKFSSIKWDYWQTVLSRGGSELGKFMVEVYRKSGGKLGGKGGKLGGNSAYKSALKELKIDISKAVNGYNADEDLPWNIIKNTVSAEILNNEYKRLQKYYK